MVMLIQFLASQLIGVGLAKTEPFIHEMESNIAGTNGLNDWYLILRYTLGLAVADVVLFLICLIHPRLRKYAPLIWLLAIFRAVGIGSGVGLGFLKNSWEDLE